MSGRRSYVARHRHGRPGLFDVAVLMATWPPLRPMRRRRHWFTRAAPHDVRGPVPVVAMAPSAVARPGSALLSHRAA